MQRPHGLLRLHGLFGSQRSASDLQGQTPSARHRALKKGLSPRWLYRSVVANAATARVAPVTRVVRIAAIFLRLAGTDPVRPTQSSQKGSVPTVALSVGCSKCSDRTGCFGYTVCSDCSDLPQTCSDRHRPFDAELSKRVCPEWHCRARR